MMHKYIVEIVGESTQKVIGNPPRLGLQKVDSWCNSDPCYQWRQRKKRYQQKKAAATKEKWKNFAKQVQESYLENERCLLERQIGKLEQAHRQGASRWNWKKMNDISDKLTLCPAGKVESFMVTSSNLNKSS